MCLLYPIWIHACSWSVQWQLNRFQVLLFGYWAFVAEILLLFDGLMGFFYFRLKIEKCVFCSINNKAGRKPLASD